MSSGDRIWIVLVQKSPKGPFTYDEVNELLARGVLRRNDLALRLEPQPTAGESKKPGSWKILWQYPEFDRRLEEKPSAAPVALPPREGGDRRQAQPNKEALVEALLPEELGEIQPEDLIGKSTREIRPTTEEGVGELHFDAERPPVDEEVRAPKWILALLFLAVGGALYGWGDRTQWWGLARGSKDLTRPLDSVITPNEMPDPAEGRKLSSRPIRNFPSSRPVVPAPNRPPPVVIPIQREPEPSPKEESRFDRAAENDREEEDRGEINEDVASEDQNKEGEDESRVLSRKVSSKPKAKEAVSEEEENPSEENSNSESQDPEASSQDEEPR